MSNRIWSGDLKGLWLAAVLTGLAAAGVVQADSLSGTALVNALRQGGYVLVMRHASSPQTPPTAAAAEPGNTRLERQLDDAGRRSARAMGAAIKALGIPIGQVWSSPTYRARETVRLAGLPAPTLADELGDAGQSMQATSATQSAWLRAKAAESPRAGTDSILVTHSPNIKAAFGQDAAGLSDGETLVFHPDGKGGEDLIGRIKIEEWSGLVSGR